MIVIEVIVDLKIEDNKIFIRKANVPVEYTNPSEPYDKRITDWIEIGPNTEEKVEPKSEEETLTHIQTESHDLIPIDCLKNLVITKVRTSNSSREVLEDRYGYRGILYNERVWFFLSDRDVEEIKKHLKI